ncbi:MAG: glycosyltransferase, partial [Anaerolineales bacterium]|nr:glycosyltransferase [Anaerolineales bacterium]
MLVPSFYPLVGGAERQLSGLLPFLRERGVQPFVLTRRLPGMPSIERQNGFQVVRTWASGHTLSFFLSSLGYLARHQSDWDIIHVHTADSPALVGATASWFWRKPLLVKIPSRGPGTALDRYSRSRWGKVRFRYLRKFIDGFIIVNSTMSSDLLKMGVPGGRVYPIPNGVDVEKFQP